MEASGVRPGLWERSLGDDAHSTHSATRDRFRNALIDMRGRAKDLAGEISHDLPQFTQHDISHLDALWELADLIAGQDLTLNPAEGFVLGASILTHDLAMSKASHLLAGGGIRTRKEWPDALAVELRKEQGRAPYPAELAAPPEHLAVRAEKFLLRDLHASTAEDLPTSSWAMQDGGTAYLINDPEIRSSYGRLIGAVAASHHWNHDQIVDRLNSPVGVPGFAPISWVVDSLLLACLLRTADAAHLDTSRTPDLLAAVRELPQESRGHWLFQSRLQRPYLKKDRLVFTASEGFSRDEMDAWWLAFDALRVVDEELRTADSVLVENGRTRLEARGVSYVDSPKSFREVAPCRDWEPVSAQIIVSDVAGLVRRLGGTELYGTDWTVGLICADNGIGMSPNVLGNQLLDFGCSSWLAPTVIRDNPGLIASRFNPTGRFGIGFFSVFMMGDRVEVVSRPQAGALSDTWILEFGDGLRTRPSLRKASPAEQLDEPGTMVKVLLDQSIANPVALPELITKSKKKWITYEGPAPLSSILSFLLPAPEVDIFTGPEGASDLELSLEKDDWQTMEADKLLYRIMGPHISANLGLDHQEIDEWVTDQAKNMRIIRDSDGRPVARAALIDRVLSRELDRWGQTSCVVTAGPARTEAAVHGTVGIFIGTTGRAARDSARPLVDPATISVWVNQEVERICASQIRYGDWLDDAAQAIIELGGDTGPWPVWRTKEGWLTQAELVRWVTCRDCIFIAHPIYADVRVGNKDHPADLMDDIVYFEVGRRLALSSREEDWPAPVQDFYAGGLPRAFLNAIMEAWGISEEVMVAFDWTREDECKVSVYQGEDIRGDVVRFVRRELQRTDPKQDE